MPDSSTFSCLEIHIGTENQYGIFLLLNGVFLFNNKTHMLRASALPIISTGVSISRELKLRSLLLKQKPYVELCLKAVCLLTDLNAVRVELSMV